MWAYHDSRNRLYRAPFGAVRVGTTVQLSIDVGGTTGASCTLRTWIDGVGEDFFPMTGETMYGFDGAPFTRFTCEYTAKVQAQVWYTFVIERPDGQVARYGTQGNATGGEGALAESQQQPSSYQLTVYKPRTTRPSWFSHGIVYQIFPDRYRRGADWRERAREAISLHTNNGADGTPGVGRRVVSDWNTEATYEKDDQGRIVAWDFYGGTLQGIKAELPHLADMGISVLYLNPIFEARSNHRYDTADYLQIDTMLGTEDDFKDLCAEAETYGISIMLDGVFNHVGSDSRYFNRFNTYAEPGAWQAHEAELAAGAESAEVKANASLSKEISPYREWFSFNDDGTYEAWWGVDDLPAVQEAMPSYREFINGENGVVRHWLRAGAKGWRLDVADELPDSFIEEIKSAALAERSDVMVLGEVWEDASNKIAYSQLRRYLLGDELDSAMNYPFRTAVLDFLMGKMSAGIAADMLMSLAENYPPMAQNTQLNLLSSHDRPRLMSVLGGALDHPEWEPWPDDFPGRLTPEQRGLAKARFWLAVLMQMTYRGVPSIYYGDELGMEGLSDPYNRGPYPWGAGDKDCATMYRNVIQLRRSIPVLTTGIVRPFASGEDVLGWWRLPSGAELADGEVGAGVGQLGQEAVPGMSACIMVNRSLSESRNVAVPSRGSHASEIISNLELRREGESVSVTLPPLGAAIILFDEAERLAKPLERGCGVVCHVTSVPNAGNPGTLGEPARNFVDWLAAAHQTYWQILPVNPTDAFGSPYAGSSAFAGNENLLQYNAGELHDLFGRFEPDAIYHEFVQANESWLKPYALFAAIADVQGNDRWQDWPADLRTYNPELADNPRFAERVRYHLFAQWEFQQEWEALRSYANERGIKIIGDIPMYPSANSADVWADPSQFCVDAAGNVEMQAGAPPDNMAPKGQLWGNPCYRWDKMASDGYSWWMRRFARTFALYDVVRLDHFLGFENYFGVPAGSDGSQGAWHAGPGLALFERAHELFGPLPILAEDLGSITPAVRALLVEVGCNGMDVLQFADNDVRYGWAPKADRVAYTSTHDTSTLVGWCAAHFGLAEGDAVTLARQLMEQTYDGPADVVMITLQDAMLLGDDARMNMPGVADGNWRWRADYEKLAAAEAYMNELMNGANR